MAFQKAVKHEAKLRMAIAGPSGSGKTWTALTFAQALGKKVAVVDTEHGSASKYADLFNFDVMEPASFSPQVFIDAINEAEKAGYDVVVLDSLSHAWSGTGGLLDIVDGVAKRMQSSNTFAAWKDATPLQNRMIDTIIGCGVHVIVTMREKQGYVLETNDRGKQVPRKVGMEPIQRDGVEYEFDVFAEMDTDNNMIITKTRCPALTGKVFPKPTGAVVTEIIAPWLSGLPAPKAEPKPSATTTNGKASTDNAARPWTPEAVKANILKVVNAKPDDSEPNEGFRGATIGAIETLLGGGVNAQQGRHLLTEFVFGEKSSLKLNAGQIAALHGYINSGQHVKAELAALVAAQLKASGQEPLL